MGRSKPRSLALCVGGFVVLLGVGCSSDGRSAPDAAEAALLDAAAYVPDATMVDFYLPARMREATGAVLPGADATAAEWQAYRTAVVGERSRSAGGPVGFGRTAETGWVLTDDGAELHPRVPGVTVADVEAEIDDGQVLSILAVDVDADGVEAALESAAADMRVTRDDRDDGVFFDAVCDGAYEECGLQLVNGMSVWVGDEIVVAGLHDEVEAALHAAEAPNQFLRSTLSAAVDAGASTGSVAVAAVQVSDDTALLGCATLGVADAQTPEQCVTERLRQLEDDSNPPTEASVVLAGSAVSDGRATIVLAFATEGDTAAIADALRDWQAQGLNVRNGQPLSEMFGAPEVVEDGEVVVASYPVPADSPAAAILWAELFVGRTLPLVQTNAT